MKRARASQTAMGTAALRALESEQPATERMCDDPYARQFIPAWFYLQVKLFARLTPQRAQRALTFVVGRCRYIDEYLQECLHAGTAQVVVLGAGLDSRAYRGELRTRAIRTFEVDHPATQASKIARVRRIFGTLPAHVVYVALDFNRETLDRLLVSGFDQSLKTLFIWEGVTLYLEQEAIDATLAWIRLHACPSSALIFDYQDTSTLTRRHRGYALLNRLTGEKRILGIEPGQIDPFLRERGFTQVVNAPAEQLEHQYCTGPNQGRRMARYYSIVHAEVGEKEGEGSHS
jgi:methyltransferase (TIGR00027 family)